MRESPLIEVMQELHSLLSQYDIPYAIIGGMAVVRSGATRTTQDIDILVTREGWLTVREVLQNHFSGFEIAGDHAREKRYGIEIDILFPGNEWEMVIPLPNPQAVREFDPDFNVWFIDLMHLLELKTAVYLKKREEDGIEVAAKDLADIVALIEANRDSVSIERIQSLAPAVRETLTEIVRNVNKKKSKNNP